MRNMLIFFCVSLIKPFISCDRSLLNNHGKIEKGGGVAIYVIYHGQIMSL